MKAKTKTRSNQPRKGTKTSRRNRPLTMALLAGLVLAGVIVYLLLPKTETSSTGPDRGQLANGTALSGNGTAKLDSSSSNDSATGISSKGSSNADDSSGDFSGIKSTLDPAVAAANSAVPQSTPKPEQTPTVSLPLVFQKIDPHQMNISPDQQKVINRIQQHFLDMIGPKQDPSDPQYLRRWQQAEPEINEELRQQLGQEVFRQYESAAAQAAEVARGIGSRRSE